MQAVFYRLGSPGSGVTRLPQQYCEEAERFLEQGNAEAALERLSTAASLDPRVRRCSSRARPRLFTEKGLCDEALVHCDAALRLAPDKKELVETREGILEQRARRATTLISQRLRTRRLGRLVWILPAIAFGLGIASAAVLQMQRGLTPLPLPVCACPCASLMRHAATRGLNLSVAEEAGIAHVSGLCSERTIPRFSLRVSV